MLRTEVLVRVAGLLLLLVFGECVGCPVRVLQCPLVAQRFLHFWLLASTIWNTLFRPEEKNNMHLTFRENCLPFQNTNLHELLKWIRFLTIPIY